MDTNETTIDDPGPKIPIDEPVVDLEGAMRPFSESSLMDAVRQDYQELVATKDTYISVVGYSSTGLSIRYRLPTSGKELDAVANKVFRQTKDSYDRNIGIAIDTMLLLCMGLYVKHPDEDNVYVELDPTLEGSPVGFDERLATAMQWENMETARQIVRKLFNGNDMAILNHAEKLNRWMMNTKADLTTEMWQVGEPG